MGSAPAYAQSGDPAGASRGFTLIEILVVISIIVALTAFLAMGMGAARDKAKHKATKALIDKIKVALESYNSEFRAYPPDGYDIGADGWDVNAQGVAVGLHPTRRLRGTAALMYFLCRPLNKVTYVGADPTDKRNKVIRRVGPFLELQPTEYSKPGFNPNLPWDDPDWDNAKDYKDCMIIDAYGRPLCYDNVKTASPPYWQYNRFQNTSGTAAGGPAGYKVHADQDYIKSGALGLLPDDEPDFCKDMGYMDILKYRCDPRFKTAADLQAVVDALEGGSPPPAATDGGRDSSGKELNGNHAPKFVGGYDLWSAGRSWVDPRDDITSWGD